MSACEADSAKRTERQAGRQANRRTSGTLDRHELATPHLSAFVVQIFQVLNYNLPLFVIVVDVAFIVVADVSRCSYKRQTIARQRLNVREK